MKCKTYLELNWTKIYIMCNNDNNAECKITNTKLCVLLLLYQMKTM